MRMGKKKEKKTSFFWPGVWICAKPKSINFKDRSSPIKIFSGFRSPWIIWWEGRREGERGEGGEGKGRREKKGQKLERRLIIPLFFLKRLTAIFPKRTKKEEKRGENSKKKKKTMFW